MIWLIDRELLAEREAICDEAVVRYSGDARTYAASLWKVAQYGFGWDFAGISRAAGSTLSRFNPFSRPPRMMRDLRFTLKLVNQGDRPLTSLKLAIQSPLFSQSGVGIEGQKSSLGAHESATVSWGYSVDDQEYALDLISNLQLKPIAVAHDLVDPPDFAGFGPGRLKRGMLLVDIVFHDIKKLVGVKN